LGNRSLLADPRGLDTKDRVNEIKQRQKFRPFAPVILEEYADQYFDMRPAIRGKSLYMQFTVPCRTPELFPAIAHADGTSRIQTVGKRCPYGIRKVLEKWHAATGCPMLLNTSLNVKGDPIVNTVYDARLFEETYGVKVCLGQ
jgi:carbamoyltransferase